MGHPRRPIRIVIMSPKEQFRHNMRDGTAQHAELLWCGMRRIHGRRDIVDKSIIPLHVLYKLLNVLTNFPSLVCLLIVRGQSSADTTHFFKSDIYPLNEHGRIFFVTRLDTILAGDLMFVASFLLFIISVLILAVFKPFSNSNGQKLLR
jgi:hypothetical protein